MPDSPPSVEGRIYELMETHLDCPVETITPTAQLGDDLGLNQVDRETLRLLLNREFSLNLTTEECAGFDTIEDLVGTVLERLTP